MYISKIDRYNKPIITLLLEKKADINVQDRDKETHSHLLFKDFFNVTKDLGSNYHTRNTATLNPQERIELFLQFVMRGANLGLKNGNHLTAQEVIYEQFNLLYESLARYPMKNKLKIQNLNACIQKIKESISINDKSLAREKLELTIRHLDSELKPLILSHPQSSIPPNPLDFKQSDNLFPVDTLMETADSNLEHYRKMKFSSMETISSHSNSLDELKTTRKSVASSESDDEQDDNATSIIIGQWGENYVYQKIRQHYRDKYIGKFTEFVPSISSDPKENMFKGFKLEGVQGSQAVSIQVEWFNMWPKECENYMHRKKYESGKYIDMLITKKRTYNLFLYTKLPYENELKTKFPNTFIFVTTTLTLLKLFYINKSGFTKEFTNLQLVVPIINEYKCIKQDSWEGLINDLDIKKKLIGQISPNSEGEFIIKERYVEIKSTSWLQTHGTVFKKRQCEAMRKYRENYCIYRLLGVPATDEEDAKNQHPSKLCKIKNPYKKILDEQLKFTSITLNI
jgi:hypothetical protein